MVDFNLEFALQTIDDDIQVQFTHTGDDGLATLLVGLNGERGIFLSELRKTGRKLVEILLGLGLYCDTDHGIGEFHGFKYDGCIFFCERITRADVLETDTGTDITCTNHLNRILLVGVHLEDTRNAFFLTRTYVVNIRTGFDLTGVNAEEGQTSHIGVGGNLEREGRSLFVFRNFTRFDLTRFRIRTFDRGRIEGRGQEHYHIVEQSLHALVLKRRTASHRNDIQCERTLTDCCNDLVFRERVGIFEELLHQRLVLLCGKFDHLLAPFVALVNEFSGDIFHVVLSTHRLIVPKDSLHLDEVHNTFEVLLCTDRNRDHTRRCTEDILHLAYHFEEVGARTVHLIYVADTGNVVFISLTPHGFRLGLHATHCTVGSYCTVEDTKRAFNLGREVNVTRSVDEIELIFYTIVSPEGSRCGRRDRDTAFLLLFHPVHGCATFVHLTDLVGFTGVEQDALGGSGLTGIDVRHDTDIARQMEVLLCHFSLML